MNEQEKKKITDALAFLARGFRTEAAGGDGRFESIWLEAARRTERTLGGLLDALADQPAATETAPSGHAMACGCARCIERRGRHEDWLGITPSGVPIMAETAPQVAPESQQSDD